MYLNNFLHLIYTESTLSLRGVKTPSVFFFHLLMRNTNCLFFRLKYSFFFVVLDKGKEALDVNMNFAFIERRLLPRWAGRVVRSWYIEMGHTFDVKEFFINYKASPNRFQNFTQMNWPITEFVGCDVARYSTRFFFSNAMILFSLLFYITPYSINRGYFVVCFYHPSHQPEILIDFPKNMKHKEFVFGKPCTKCGSTRKICSRNFPGLCGVGKLM